MLLFTLKILVVRTCKFWCVWLQILYGRDRLSLKITSVVYLHIILFKMYERDTATEKECDTALQMTLGHFQTQY